VTVAESLELALERQVCADEAGRPRAVRDLARELEGAMRAGALGEAAAALRRAIVVTLDYTSAQTLYRSYRSVRPHLPATGSVARLAVLGSFTSEPLTQLIELFLFAGGARPEVWEADYGVFRQEILDPDSELYRFRPRVVFLATSWRDLGHLPVPTDTREAVQSLAEQEFAEWSGLWQTAHDRLGCQIIQNGFDPPPWRAFGNHELRHPAGLARYIARINATLMERAPLHVTLHDTDSLAAAAGRWAWGDERYFHHAKLPCAPESLVDYAHSVASLILAQLGLGKKCLVLDLDNTLWGGVIGDDGLGGIRLGQGEAEGEAYAAFQRYVKALQSRGVILAVCSKNEESIARTVFEQHPEMVLRLDDISCFVANWEDKPSNLRAIARRLDIGLNSLVFVDDNPAERAIVRKLAPEVAVPELPADPAGYIRALDQHRHFQVVSVGSEDFQRTQFYRANAAREQAAVSSANIDEFLQSLAMTARIGPINPTTLERSAQLIGRSNQFNLTTRRYSPAEVLKLVGSEQWITRTVTLADRFGDNGLISVVLARIEGDALGIDTWLMSCRVLKRGVEDFVLNHLAALARGRGLSVIRGEYIPTAKNGLVREHYSRLGFLQARADADGHTWWELPLSRELEPRTCFIREILDDE